MIRIMLNESAIRAVPPGAIATAGVLKHGMDPVGRDLDHEGGPATIPALIERVLKVKFVSGEETQNRSWDVALSRASASEPQLTVLSL